MSIILWGISRSIYQQYNSKFFSIKKIVKKHSRKMINGQRSYKDLWNIFLVSHIITYIFYAWWVYFRFFGNGYSNIIIMLKN